MKESRDTSNFMVATAPYISQPVIYYAFVVEDGRTPTEVHKTFTDPIACALYVKEWQEGHPGEAFPYKLHEMKPVRLVKKWNVPDDDIVA